MKIFQHCEVLIKWECWIYLPGEGNQLEAEVADRTAEPLSAAEVARGDGLEDLVDGLLRGDGAVESDEVTLQSLWDVIPASPGMNHGRHVLDIWRQG